MTNKNNEPEVIPGDGYHKFINSLKEMCHGMEIDECEMASRFLCFSISLFSLVGLFRGDGGTR